MGTQERPYFADLRPTAWYFLGNAAPVWAEGTIPFKAERTALAQRVAVHRSSQRRAERGNLSGLRWGPLVNAALLPA